MLIGRFLMIVPILAIAGSMAASSASRRRLGTFPTTGPSVVGLLIGVVLIVGALTYFPALVARPDRRAAPPERRQGVLTHEPHASLMSVDLGRGTRRFQRFVDARRREARRGEPPRPRGVLDPELLRSALPAVVPQARPAAADKNPVMFVVEIGASSPPS